MNKKDFIGGNGDASVVYSSEDINGEKKQSLVINGKEVDFTDKKSVKEAKEYFENARNGSGAMFLKMFGINPDDIFNQAIEALESKHHEALEAKKNDEAEEEEDFDWGIVPWENDAWKYADDYLKEKFNKEYNKLDDEGQYRMLKTVAESFEWLFNKIDEK